MYAFLAIKLIVNLETVLCVIFLLIASFEWPSRLEFPLNQWHWVLEGFLVTLKTL